jgi:putative transposon-encoded protein
MITNNVVLDVRKRATIGSKKGIVHVIVPKSMLDVSVWVELEDKTDKPFDYHPVPFGHSARVIVPREWLGKLVRVKVIESAQ